MEFLDLAKRRASVRAYQKRSVERAVLEQVLEAGRICAHGLQPPAGASAGGPHP